MSNAMFFNLTLNTTARINQISARIADLNNCLEDVNNQIAAIEEGKTLKSSAADITAANQFNAAVASLDPSSSTYQAEYLSLFTQYQNTLNANSMAARTNSTDLNVLNAQATLYQQEIERLTTQQTALEKQQENAKSSNNDLAADKPKYKVAKAGG